MPNSILKNTNMGAPSAEKISESLLDSNLSELKNLEQSVLNFSERIGTIICSTHEDDKKAENDKDLDKEHWREGKFLEIWQHLPFIIYKLKSNLNISVDSFSQIIYGRDFFTHYPEAEKSAEENKMELVIEAIGSFESNLEKIGEFINGLNEDFDVSNIGQLEPEDDTITPTSPTPPTPPTSPNVNISRSFVGFWKDLSSKLAGYSGKLDLLSENIDNMIYRIAD